MGAGVELPTKGGKVRGTRRQLQKWAKNKNLPNRWIKEDELGFYIKLGDRGGIHRRKRKR